MTEEEEKAVESLKIKAEFIGDNYIFSAQAIRNLRKELTIVLNLIEKQQKENEELKNESKSKLKAYDDCYCEYKHYKQYDSIPKDKIREKIKKLQDANDYLAEAMIKAIEENNQEKFSSYNNSSKIFTSKIEILKELLEE